MNQPDPILASVISRLGVIGDVSIVLTDEHGNEKARQDIKNLVVTAGTSFIASRMKDATATPMSHMALGSGNTAAGAGQTALVTELGRVALTATNVTANAVQYTATFGPGVGTGAVVEAGIFNAGAAGTMLCRTVFGVLTKGASDTITVTWTVTITG